MPNPEQLAQHNHPNRRRFLTGLMGLTATSISGILTSCGKPNQEPAPSKAVNTKEKKDALDGFDGPLRLPKEASPDKRWKPVNTLDGERGKLGYILTTDDGTPLNPTPTLEFAEHLQEQGIKAHFFICGRNRKEDVFHCPGFTPSNYGNKDLIKVKKTAYYKNLVSFIKKIAEKGHSVHNHTWNHTYMSELTPPRQISAYIFGITVLQNALNEALPHQTLKLFRYPGGNAPKPEQTALQNDIQDAFRGCGIDGSLNWAADTNDWQTDPKNRTIEQAVGNARENKGVLLMHDRTWRTTAEKL